MAKIIQIRRDTAANWTSENPILANGETGLETDTKNTKCGDGVTVWNSLGYSFQSAIVGVADATERKAITTGSVGVTRVIQADLIGIVWNLVAADESLDASWIGLPYTVDPDGDIIINMQLADMAGIVPDANVLGQVNNRPTMGNGIDYGGKKLAFQDELSEKPDGYVRMVSVKTSNIPVTVKHDGTDSCTGFCYSVDGDAVVYTAQLADTSQSLSIPHNGGAPAVIHIWPSTATQERAGNLTTLHCQSNSLTSLDVSGLTALTSLSCNTNSLTSLDASGLTALTELNCINNSLTSLDASGLTALTELYCSNNSLTSLDLSGLTALTTLNCYSNSLTSLDVSGLTALTYLSCANNPLTSLLATGIDLSFEYFGTGSNIGDNLLTEAALIAFVDSLATTTTGAIEYGGNTGSAAFLTWLATGDDKGYIWLNI